MEDIEKAIRHLEEEVHSIKRTVDRLSKRPDMLFRQEWMDGQGVLLALNISTRTLSTLRATGILTPTRLLKKYYYKVKDIEALLQQNFIRDHKKQQDD